MIDLSVVLVNYGTPRLTRGCISAVIDSAKLLDIEILLVDNSANKERLDYLAAEFPQLTYIPNEKNIGFGRACNQGIDAARGTFILLLNTDTQPISECLYQCVAFMRSDFAMREEIDLLGCQLIDTSGSITPSSLRRYNNFRQLMRTNLVFRSLNFIVKKTKPEPIREQDSHFCDGVSGAFMLFRREALAQKYRFDPDLFLYAEELELCDRFSREHKCYYYSKYQTIHFSGGSGSSLRLYSQSIISLALFRYKKGLLQYAIHLTMLLANFLTDIMALPILFWHRALQKRIAGFLLALPILTADIPRYPKRFGARSTPLKISNLNS